MEFPIRGLLYAVPNTGFAQMRSFSCLRGDTFHRKELPSLGTHNSDSKKNAEDIKRVPEPTDRLTLYADLEKRKWHLCALLNSKCTLAVAAGISSGVFTDPICRKAT